MIQGAITDALHAVPILTLVALAAVVGSLLVVRRLLGRPLTAGLRDRFVLGLPWGTLLTVAGLLVIYAVVQGGWDDPHDPLVLPFRTWGYDYLVGTVFAAFTHNGWGHLTNNVTATIAFAGVAEYAWGHYPRSRGVSVFSSLAANPYARVLVVPAFAIVVGLFTSVTGLGPLIGFSGVVFAFAGFGLIMRPITTALALVGIHILELLLSTITEPWDVARIFPAVITPWWAEVAIQTHGVGLVTGLLAGIGYAWYRREWSDPLHVWFAVLVFAIAEGMWAVFMPITGSSWLLLRWLGTALVFVLATLAAVGAYRRDRELLGWIGLHRRELAIGLLIVGVGAMALAAIPFHLADVGEEPAPNGVVEVRDYTVGYGEGVPEGYVAAVDLPIGSIPTVETSGVIVTNEDRNLWRLAIPKERLASNGQGSVLVGGLGWRERVYADWVGWEVAGNESVYKVYLSAGGREWHQAFASGPSRSDVTIAGYNMTFAPTDDEFVVAATDGNRTVGTVPIPEKGERAELGRITFVREGRQLVVLHEGTSVPVAKRTQKAE